MSAGGPRGRGGAGGRVVMVGAGPGAPDLVTLRGLRWLRAADVVVYDALAPAELLLEAPERALRVNVGKRGHEAPTRSYEETVALLLEHARAGRTVVRLKGGDPFVFGRGGEEASACRAAGIPVEVVPGVSSAIGALAWAGIPVTDRRHAASFAVVTGHKDPTRVREGIRWRELARGADTLVVLMGMRNLEEVCARLLAAGRAPDTPAAVVMLGTTPAQRVVEAPLSELAKRAREAELGAPAAVVVGDVVRLRGELAWYEERPLFGWRVLVTRPAAQAEPLAQALRDAGAEPVCVPMTRVEALPLSPELARALDAPHAYDAVCLASANAARVLAERLRERGVAPESLRPAVFCVGAATAEAARAAGFPARRLPGQASSGAGLAEAMGREGRAAGLRVLLPRAQGGREELAEGLRAAGARADAFDLYRSVPEPVDAEALRAELARGRLHALTFASPSAVRRFTELLDAPARAAARHAVVAALGSTTAGACREAGLTPRVVPERPAAEALAEALAAHAAAERAAAAARAGGSPGEPEP